MTKTSWTCLMAVLALGLGARAQDSNPDATIPCGEIVSMRLVDRGALTLEWDVRKFKEEPVLDKDEKFAVVMIKLGPNKSIGKYDYTLGGNTCLAMAINPNAFNPMNWEFKDQPETSRIELVYKVNAADDKKGYAFLYRYVDRANIFVGPQANCVNRTVSTRGIGAGSPVAMAGQDGEPNEGGKKAGTRGKKSKKGKGKKAAADEEEAGEDEAGEDEPTPKKKKGGDEGDAEKPAKKGGDEDEGGNKNQGL